MVIQTDNRRKKIILGKTDRGNLEFTLEQMLEKHWAIRGITGQRKSLFLMSMLIQYIPLALHCVVYIDLAGDQAAYWILRKAAEKAGKNFYCLTLEPDVDSCNWCPLHGVPAYRDDPMFAASGLTQGLALIGDKKYWSRQNQSTMNEAFDNLKLAGQSCPTFEEIASELKRMGKSSGSGPYTSEAYLAATHLLRYEALTHASADGLDLAKLIDEAAVLVVHIPTPLYADAARAVASLVSSALMVEVAHRARKGKEHRFVHEAIDEFAEIVATAQRNLVSSLVLCRKWGLMKYHGNRSRVQSVVRRSGEFAILPGWWTRTT